MSNFIIIDLDDTITIDSSHQNYSQKKSNHSVVKAMRNAEAMGISSRVFSARNMRSLKEDINKIEQITRPIAEKWLYDNDIPFEKLILGKPWSGKEGFYVDDKNLSIEEFIFKFSSPFFDKKVSIVVSLYNEVKNIEEMHKNNLKAERYFNIKEFIYVDNGSQDGTGPALERLKEQHDKVKIISLSKNQGYGGGFKEGIFNSSGDVVITNHADLQFDIYEFVTINYDTIMKEKEIKFVAPYRLNRPLIDRFNTSILRNLISFLSFTNINDFNGQPKIMDINLMPKENELPDDFCLDLALYKNYQTYNLELPTLQKNRLHGKSSWNGYFIKRLKIFYRYIAYSLFKK